jgi:hypothetical protein
MCLLDLFPAGIHQLFAVMDRGLWFARSQSFILGQTFQTMTWMRIIGGALFTVGGVVPLTWFMITRAASLRPEWSGPGEPCYTVPPSILAVVDGQPDLIAPHDGIGLRQPT